MCFAFLRTQLLSFVPSLRRLRFFLTTGRPYSFHIRCTRLRLTLHPSTSNKLFINLQPYRLYLQDNLIISCLNSLSLSGRLCVYPCVALAWINTLHARRSETFIVSCTCSTALVFRDGLSSFPLMPHSISLCQGRDQLPLS